MLFKSTPSGNSTPMNMSSTIKTKILLETQLIVIYLASAGMVYLYSVQFPIGTSIGFSPFSQMKSVASLPVTEYPTFINSLP